MITMTLESIIGTGESISLPLGALKESPLNSFELTDIEEMKSSIQSVGLITPLSVAGPDRTGAYEVLSGGRRFRAIKELAEGGVGLESVPCYVVGCADMSETEKRLLIEVANITSRGSDAVHSHRFEVIRLLKELEDEDPGKYKNVLKSATKYLKVSDRYSRMYRQVFNQAGDALKELASSGNIRINDASRLSSLPKGDQEAAAKEVEKAKSAKEKAEIVSRYTAKARGVEKEASEPAPEKTAADIGGTPVADALEKGPEAPASMADAGGTPEAVMTGGRVVTSIADLDAGKFDYLLDDSPSMELSVGRTTGMQEKVSAYAESYQGRLAGIIEWTEQMMKKDTPTEEEWDVIDACKRLVEKFQ